jgi:SNF2 family DNA or RNA helicase
MIEVKHNSQNSTAELINDYDSQSWYDFIKLFSGRNCKRSGQKIIVPWIDFLNNSEYVEYISKQYPNEVSYDLNTQSIIKASRESIDLFAHPRDDVSVKDIEIVLEKNGFSRKLFPYQIRNLKKLICRNSSASFSVPGAGKTTEALAFFTYLKKPKDKLLVISPKSAFKAWRDEIGSEKGCFKGKNLNLVEIFTTDNRTVQNILESSRLLIVNYDKLIRINDTLREFLEKNSVFIIIDESHYVKSEYSNRTNEVLSLAHLANHKLILSGTPIPNTIEELIPQFKFLYPEIYTTPYNIRDKVNEIYVRTTRDELNIPKEEIKLISIPLSRNQIVLYKLIKEYTLKHLSVHRNPYIKTIKRSAILLLQLISNPLLGLNRYKEIPGVKDNENILLNLESPKIDYVMTRARELANQNKKLIVWSNFVQNIEIIHSRLSDINALKIHGGVPQEERDTSIDLFNFDSDYHALVINPATGAEALNLHYNCNHAIYIDRSFNSVHWIQSMDRIRRIGQEKKPIIEVLIHNNTIDERIESVLKRKVKLMEEVLNDKAISAEPIRADYYYDREDSFDKSIEEELEEILAALQNESDEYL